MSLLLLALLPFAGSVVAAALPGRNAASIWSGLVAIAGAVGAARYFPQVRDGGVVVERLEWIPSLGLDFTLRMDGFAWMFAMLVLGIGALVILYARYYMARTDPVPRFFSFLLAFMGSMLCVVIAGNLLLLALFWELTSLFSFLLIGYWHHRKDARRGARMALVVTGSGGLALLVGLVLIGRIAGSYELDVVLAEGARVRAHALYPVALGLVLLGALTKSAQFPFHSWLPRAMAAPTPVSAYLHSAAMVKMGVFLLARLWPVLGGTEAWFWSVGGAGLATLLLGAYLAMFQNDLKALLAYSTVSHLGLITLLLGLNSPYAAVAAVFHIMNHATFKASLFMAAGILDHETGTRSLRRLTGLRAAMPITAALAMVASGAMAGVPLLNGFLSKEMFFAETVFVSSKRWVEVGLPLAATLAGVFAVVYSLRVGHGIFFGPPGRELPRAPHEPPRWMRVPVELLVLVCVAVGIAPSLVIGPALAAAARPVVGGVLPEYSLAVWHGFNAPFLMSLVAMGVGIAGYLVLRRARAEGRLLEPPGLAPFDGRRAFERGLALTDRAARALLRLLGTRRLQPQMFGIAGVALLAALAAAWGHDFGWGERPRVPASPEFVMFWMVGMACAVGAAMQAKFHRLAAITMLAGAGLITCLTFAWFSAPDLALTQLAVEVVTTVLLLLGLRWLPRRREEEEGRPTRAARIRRSRDLALATLVGTGVAALSYAMLTRPAPHSIAPFFLGRALPEGGGANVVNVMLVDFRAFDTLGEITVLGAVALTVFALLRRFRPPLESDRAPRQQRVLPADRASDLVDPGRDALGYLRVPTVLARLLMPIAFLVAIHLFLRGHNAPGGGFVAGLVVAIAFILQYMVAGTEWSEAHLGLRPARWIANGWLAALATGLGAVLLGFPFLTTHTAHWRLPLLGEVHLPSAMFFDVGVFAAVVGATLMILVSLAHQSIRGRRRASRPAPGADGLEA